MKTKKDLEQCIPNLKTFLKAINNIHQFSKHKGIIDTGRLSEYYCSRLFGLTLSEKSNDDFDAICNKTKIKVEIKQRKFFEDYPPSLAVGLKKQKIMKKENYLMYFAIIDENFLPYRIYKIKSKDIDLNGNRINFKRAFDNKKIELVFKY